MIDGSIQSPARPSVLSPVHVCECPAVQHQRMRRCRLLARRPGGPCAETITSISTCAPAKLSVQGAIHGHGVRRGLQLGRHEQLLKRITAAFNRRPYRDARKRKTRSAARSSDSVSIISSPEGRESLYEPVKVLVSLLALGGCLSVQALQGQEPAKERVDLGMLAAVRSEELNHSKVMDHAGMDRRRLRARVARSGISTKPGSGQRSSGDGDLAASRGRCPRQGFGVPTLDRRRPAELSPSSNSKSFTPGTKGRLTADVVRVQIDSEEDFAKYRGKLQGKIIVRQPVREVKDA